MVDKNSFKSQTVTGLFWSFIDIFASQGIQFIVLMILARLLLPEDFGVIGLTLIFIAISNTIIDSGFSQALIRKNNVTQKDYSTVFFFNLLMSFILFISLFFIAPFISHFFNEAQLTGILRIVSIGLIINSLGIIQKVILIKKINFRVQSIINAISTIISGIIAIIFSMQGFGVWSLVFQNLSLQIIQSLLLWIINRWTPSFLFDIVSFKKMYGFGSKLLLSNLIDTLYNNLFSILIGRLYPASQLGFYTNAVKLRDVVTNSTTSALQRVTYPVLSNLQANLTQLKDGYITIIRTSSFMMFPIMTGLIAISDTLIPLLFGEKWIESILYFKLLCIAGMLYPLHAINLNILQVKGRSDLFLILEIVKKVVLTLLIALSLFFSLGIVGLISAAIVSSYLSLFLNAYYSSREIAYSFLQQLRDILPVFIISILMGVIVYSIGRFFPNVQILKLLLQIGSGICIFIGASWLFKLKEVDTLKQIIAHLFQKARNKQIKSRSA